MCIHALPVVEQDVWRPDLICGEAEVFNSRMFALVPLEIVVEPTLKHTHTHDLYLSGLQGIYFITNSPLFFSLDVM